MAKRPKLKTLENLTDAQAEQILFGFCLLDDEPYTDQADIDDAYDLYADELWKIASKLPEHEKKHLVGPFAKLRPASTPELRIKCPVCKVSQPTTGFIEFDRGKYKLPCIICSKES